MSRVRRTSATLANGAQVPVELLAEIKRRAVLEAEGTDIGEAFDQLEEGDLDNAVLQTMLKQLGENVKDGEGKVAFETLPPELQALIK